MKHKAAALLALLALACSGPAAWASSADFSASPLSEHLLRVSGPSGNTLVAVDNDGLILVDGVPARYAAEYLDFIRQETGQDTIKALINSHWHHDETGLNAMLGRRGVDIIAHENTRAWLGATIRQRGAEILHSPVPPHALPGNTFYQSGSLPFRGGRMEYGHLAQAHTDGDLYVYFPRQNVLYTGDVLHGDAWAVVDEATNGFIGGLMEGLDTLAGIIDADTTIVPGSGPVLGKEEFDAQRAMYKGLMEEMVALLRSAKSAPEVVEIDPATPLRPEWDNAAAFLDQGFRSFYLHLRNTRHVGGMP